MKQMPHLTWSVPDVTVQCNPPLTQLNLGWVFLLGEGESYPPDILQDHLSNGQVVVLVKVKYAAAPSTFRLLARRSEVDMESDPVCFGRGPTIRRLRALRTDQPAEADESQGIVLESSGLRAGQTRQSRGSNASVLPLGSGGWTRLP